MSVDSPPPPVPLPVPSAVPASGDRRRHPAPAHLRFFHGPMDCGKSTLALQVDHNQSRQGRHGLLVTQGDRSAAPQISSRVGLCRDALEIDAGTDLRLLVRDRWAAGNRVDYLIVDEAQFLDRRSRSTSSPSSSTSRTSTSTPSGSPPTSAPGCSPAPQRLLEVADDVQRIQVEVLCWCGLPGLLNARVVGERNGPRGRHGGRRRHRTGRRR